MKVATAVCILSPLLFGCAVSPSSSDPCVQYNQGMRVTPNREWPAAVGKAKNALSEMRLATFTVGAKNPAEYDRLAAQYHEALDPAIANAGSCFDGSLFEDIVAGMNEEFLTLNRRLDEKRAEWEEQKAEEAAREARRLAREAAIHNLPAATKIHRVGDVEVEIVSIQSTQFATSIRLRILNRSNGRIVKARTAAVWGYDADSPGYGGTSPIGFDLVDNFGNRFSLSATKPHRYGQEAGLHPHQSEEFEVSFRGYPPESASTVTLVIWRGTFGNSEQHEIVLPRDVFLP